MLGIHCPDAHSIAGQRAVPLLPAAHPSFGHQPTECQPGGLPCPGQPGGASAGPGPIIRWGQLHRLWNNQCLPGIDQKTHNGASCRRCICSSVNGCVSMTQQLSLLRCRAAEAGLALVSQLPSACSSPKSDWLCPAALLQVPLPPSLPPHLQAAHQQLKALRPQLRRLLKGLTPLASPPRLQPLPPTMHPPCCATRQPPM